MTEISEFDEMGLSNLITEVLLFDKLCQGVSSLRDFVVLHIYTTSPHELTVSDDKKP